LIFYPQHCYDCGCTYISEERHEKCWSCNSNNTVNCYGEELKADDRVIGIRTMAAEHGMTPEEVKAGHIGLFE